MKTRSRTRAGFVMPLPFRAIGVFPLVSLAFVGGCQPTASLPGTSLGDYNVVGTLGTNTCGSGINPTNPWDFTVELSEDGTTLYMAKTDGTDEVSGAVASTAATLTSVVTSNVDGSDAGGAGTCDMTDATTFTLTLATAAAPASFTGSVSYTYSAATGVSSAVNCTDQLTASGGTYATLPCTVTYALAGTKK